MLAIFSKFYEKYPGIFFKQSFFATILTRVMELFQLSLGLSQLVVIVQGRCLTLSIIGEKDCPQVFSHFSYLALP